MSCAPDSEHLLATILASTEDAILSFTLDGTIERWSCGAQRLYGYSAEEIIGQPVTRLMPLYEMPVHQAFLRTDPKKDLACCETTERLRKDGTRIRVTLKRVPIHDKNGKTEAILETGKTVSTEDAEAAREWPLQLLAQEMPCALWTTDRNLRVTLNLGTGVLGTQIRPLEFVGRSVYEYLQCKDPHMDPIAQHYEALRGVPSRFEFRKNDRVMEVRLEPLRDAEGQVTGCIGVGMDVTERKKNEEQMRYQSTHDALTGLANYREFLDTLEHEVRRASRSHHSFSVLLLDLDDLKRINDNQGHLAGNQALRRLAEAMKEHCRSTDLAARYGGDEFAVVLIDSDPGMANNVAERVENALRNDEETPRLSVSIGIAVFPDDGRTAHELLETADQRLYKRKSSLRAGRASAR